MNNRITQDDDRTIVADDNIQHGIDDNPNKDPEKGATLGGVGGAAVGLAAGAAAGPIGAVAGAIIGGAAGALLSGAAVAAVDAVDNDNNITGLGNDANRNDDETGYTFTSTRDNSLNRDHGTPVLTEEEARANANSRNDDRGIVAADPALMAPGVYTDPALRTPGAFAPPVIGGVPVIPVRDANVNERLPNTEPDEVTGYNQLPGEKQPSLKTGGQAIDGTPDTRGIGEKVVDAVTGDPIDDKTGKRIA